MENELNDAIAGLISTSLGIARDEITDDFSYGDVPQWDSMGHMSIMMALEEQYNVQISADTITNLVSLPTIVKYILELHND
ncbi:MAG: acyl carrier protein [Anaerolineaceae bacterium]|nr:acyl carrier protein [Anaerolineaceae bacterium]MBN2677653.1 acyl carrier protein [Anaerolineaceae bacterium]